VGRRQDGAEVGRRARSGPIPDCSHTWQGYAWMAGARVDGWLGKIGMTVRTLTPRELT
jgi:hypothetical protein